MYAGTTLNVFELLLSPQLSCPIPQCLTRLSPPLSHNAVQELREIHSRQQRQKQKELEGERGQMQEPDRKGDLQEDR